jgi:hypothetical protein
VIKSARREWIVCCCLRADCFLEKPLFFTLGCGIFDEMKRPLQNKAKVFVNTTVSMFST